MNPATFRLLVIEDNPADVVLLRDALERDPFARYHLTVAGRLDEGLATFAQTAFDAILLDLELPDASGLAGLRRLRAAAGDMPIVVLAGLPDGGAALRAVQAGAQDFLVKDTAGWATVARVVRYAGERHNLVQANKAGEQRFASIFQRNPAGQIITSLKERRCVDVNAAFCHMLGYEREELIGRTTLELGIWADPADRRASFDAFDEAGSIQNREVAFRTRCGDLRNVLVSAEPIVIDGEPCVISTALDITELTQSEQRHRLIASVLSDYVYSGLVFADGRTRTEWVSGAFEAITGYTMDEINAMPDGFVSLILAEDAEKIASQFTSICSLPAATLEYRIRRKDGAIRWVRDYMQHVPSGESEGAVRRVGAVQDITERKLAGEAIRSNERQMRALVSSLDDIVFEVDARGTYRNVWTANEASLFRPRAEIIGKRFDEIFGEEASRPFFAYLERTLASDTAQTLEYPLELAGTQRWFIARYNPIHGAEETRPRVSILVRDISAQKQAEVQLRESQRHSQAMLDAIPDMMFRLDRQGTFLDYRAERRELMAQDRPSLIGLRNRDIAPAEFADLIEQKIEETLATGTLQTFEYQLPVPGRGDQDYEARMSPSGADEVIAIVRNVTERKQAEEKLRASEAHFATIFRTSPFGIILTQLDDGSILDVNDAFLNLFGYRREDAIGRTTLELQAFADPTDRARFTEQVRQTGQILGAEAQFRKNSGDVGTIFFSAEAIEMAGRKTLLSMMVDITERKRTEALISAQRDLARSIGSFNTVEEGFSAILATVLQLTGMDSGGIYLFTPDYQRLDLIYHHGLGAEFVDAVTNFAMESGNVQAILSGKPHYVPGDDPVLRTPVYQVEGLHSLAVVPVLSQAHVIGCLNLGSHTKDEVSPFARQVLETLAAEIGNVVLHLQSQAALHASEEKYRSLVEATDATIVMLDADGRIQYMNEKAAETSGIASADAVGKTMHELLAREIADLNLERVKTVIATGQGMVVESPIADGRYYLRTSVQPVHDEQGVPVMALMSATDITDLKHAQRELLELNLSLEQRVRERTAEVRDLYDNAPIGYHSLDAAGRFIQVNQTELNWFGYTRDELIGQHVAEMLTQESVDLFRKYFPIYKLTGLLRDLELDFVRKDGSILPGLVNATAVYDEGGNYLMSRSTVFDNSERRAAEQALRESEEQNRLLFENTPDAVALFDGQGRILRANHAFELLTGFAVEACIGETMHSLGLLPDHEVAAIASAVMESLHSKSRFAAAEFRITSANGDEHVVGARVFGVTFQGRQHYLTSMRDITVEKEAAETLRLANLEMERALRMKDEFLTNMSHELRTPLTGILGLSELLQMQAHGPLNERQQRSVQYIEDSGRHLLALINDLLDISKIEAGKMELHCATVAVDKLCQASLQFVREAAAKKQIQVEYTNEHPGLRFSADELRLKQMLVNLLNNAVKFTPQGGRVRLSVATDPGANLIHFAVCDNGPGIATADQTRLFKPFTQLESHLARQHEGTGLGLVLVKQLAELHGGTVRLDSAGIPGEGSCFTISLPYQPVAPAPPAAADQSAPAGAPGAAPGSGPLILLAEDNEVNIETVAVYLTHAGYRVVVARTGLEALAQADAVMPDLILMDIQMPLLDGLEVTRRLRRQVRFADTPIIALTASAMSGDRERCLAAGATGYLSKPFRLTELQEMIETRLSAG